jgi:hypothetical protein
MKVTAKSADPAAIDAVNASLRHCWVLDYRAPRLYANNMVRMRPIIPM